MVDIIGAQVDDGCFGCHEISLVYYFQGINHSTTGDNLDLFIHKMVIEINVPAIEVHEYTYIRAWQRLDTVGGVVVSVVKVTVDILFSLSVVISVVFSLVFVYLFVITFVVVVVVVEIVVVVGVVFGVWIIMVLAD